MHPSGHNGKTHCKPRVFYTVVCVDIKMIALSVENTTSANNQCASDYNSLVCAKNLRASLD